MGLFLVTGGSGFVGTNLCAKLVQSGHEVVSVDNYSNGLASNEVPGVVYINDDVALESTWEKLWKFKFNAVFHLAAQSSNATSFKNPRLDLEANQISTLHALEYCKSQGIKRLIFTSSMSVYGNPNVTPTPSSEIPNPQTFYAAHKATSESYIRFSNDLNWTIFRLYTTYGSGQNMSNLEQGLVKIFLGFIMRNEPIRVHGSLDRIRDIVHVSDVVEALMLSIDQEKSHNKIYNLGSGVTLTVREIIEQLLVSYGRPLDYPIITEEADQGDPFVTHAEIEDVRADLDWEPRISPQTGILLTIKKYIKES
jgi:UDP-glucose 4-epimerase